jgi:hypothetical protein
MADLEQYLEHHALQERLNAMLNELAEQRPADPRAWMADKLAAIGTQPAPSWPQPGDASEDMAVQQMSARWAGVLAFHEAASAPPAPPPAAAAPPATAPTPAAARAPAPAAAPPSGAAPVDAGAAAAGAGSADKEAKKAAKAEEKRKKEEDKERRRLEREEAARQKADGPEVPTVTLLDFESHSFGNLLIQSHTTTGREWSRIESLSASGAPGTVWLRGRIHTSRKQSTKLGFVVLRQRLATVQAVVQGKELTAFLCSLPKESVVDLCVTVAQAPVPIIACSRSDIELSVDKAFCVSRAAMTLPIQVGAWEGGDTGGRNSRISGEDVFLVSRPAMTLPIQVRRGSAET